MAQGGISYYFKTADIITKIIAINVVVFLFVTIFSALFQINPYDLIDWFELPKEFHRFILQPWSIITYSFLHIGFLHILFNMLWLYFFGRYVTNLFSDSRFLYLYFFSAIVGGIVFMVSYNLFPALIHDNRPLIGASASVMGLMGFAATYSPNAPIRIFTIQLKLWHIALIFVLWDLVSLGSLNNAGGLLAHLGGVSFGYVYARQLIKGREIGILKWFENLFKSKEKKPFKKVHRNRTTQSASQRSMNKDSKSDHQQKVDKILDKIGKSGYESLSKEEKDFLFKAGKEN
ncbi:MAG: rhomboid family intramembrane serine protease [Flavobacteriaceae bacterium]